MNRHQTIRDQLDVLVRLGILSDYQHQTRMPGSRWTLYSRQPGLGLGSSRAYSTGEVEAFITGAILAVPSSDPRWDAIRTNTDEYPHCPQCGDPIDYCQGHGSY